MKKLIYPFLILLAFGAFNPVSAQKISLKSGSLDFLKGVEILKLKYSYADMKVGKFDSEKEYVDKKMETYNAKNPGSGDKWYQSWLEDRQKRFQPKFEQLFNEILESKKSELRANEDTDSHYIMIFHTTYTEPGYNIGVSRRNAYIDAEVTFVKSDDPNNELARIIIDNSPGREAFGNDYDTGLRIQEAYAKAGKELAYFIWKQALK